MWGKTAVVMAGVSAMMGAAQAVEREVAAVFGARKAVQDIALSPDGTHVAMSCRLRGAAAQCW